MSQTSTQTQEKTYRAYTKSQGAEYAKNRGSYPTELYETILNHHNSTGGHLSTLVDVGCGPGNGIRPFAPHFQDVMGLDPSPSMIDTARSVPSATASDKPIRFEVSTAEDLASELNPSITIPTGTVDMITVATAAHWFDMSKFYPRAAQLLKPSGTLAIWEASSLYAHPRTPNYEKIKKIIHHLDCEVLAPYLVEGNHLARNLYRDLPLPWTIFPPEPAFAEKDFVRNEYNPDGECDINGNFFFRQETMDMERFENVMGTASAVTRWRDRNKNLIGTEKDCVNVAVREIKEALWEVGVKKGEEWIETGVAGVLLMFKRA